jgi:hypothetical protein
MNPLFYICTWALLAVVVLGMAAYRYLLVRHEDATLDVMESASLASEQARVFKKAAAIERWGKPLTLVVIVYGLVLVGVYMYHAWELSGQIQR